MDTIVAVSTPPGRSAIGVVRVSGPQALQITRKLTNEQELSPVSHHAILKTLCDEHGVIDQALITFFKGPHSFTGEDMVEFSCHGSPIVIRQVIDLILAADARLAEPGEFTLRACRNGKMNLSQAEAVRDLIDAQTHAAAVQATRQLRGELSERLTPWKEKLIHTIVVLESALEFVEDDLPPPQVQELQQTLADVASELTSLAQTYGAGHLLRDGLKVAIIGRPNVGKSSLFNRLVGLDRAIVTELPGTTRDSLTESISIAGVPVVLTDTAGVREAGDRIEEIGIQRTRRAAADADLLMVVIDGSRPLEKEDVEVLAEASEVAHIIAVNKSDLEQSKDEYHHFNSSPVVYVSALTSQGISDLLAAIVEPFGPGKIDSADLLITNGRHYDLLTRSQREIAEAQRLLREGASEEIVLVHLHNALRFLGAVTGETTTEEILAEIFQTFCIGK